MAKKAKRQQNEKRFNINLFTLGFVSCLAFIFLLSFSGIWAQGMPIIKQENSTPGNWINLDEIELTSNGLILNIPNLKLSSYEPTGSMKPVLDYEANGIMIIPENSDQINIGDIVTFGKENIVHRVIEKGEDLEGIWFITQGDNNTVADQKIRFEDIKYVTIGILY